MEKLALLAGGVAAAYAFLPLLENNYARAATIADDDVRLTAHQVAIQGVSGEITAYQAQPADQSPLPGVLVIHENKGLNPHIEDVARRVALGGYLALAPDAMSGQGGSPADPEQAAEMIKTLDMEETRKNFEAAAAYLKTHPQSTGKVGVVGFCWGGAMANQLAVHSNDVTAVVSYYGRQPASEEVASISAPLLLHYAGLDERINQGIEAFRAALDKDGVHYELYLYGGAQHAFNNDTNEARYDRQAAELAWQRTMAFFEKHLKG